MGLPDPASTISTTAITEYLPRVVKIIIYLFIFSGFWDPGRSYVINKLNILTPTKIVKYLICRRCAKYKLYGHL